MSADVLKKCWWGYLAVLTFRLGGVAGATRRIVFSWPGDFTGAQIENTLRHLYPGLRAGNTQVADVIEWMRRRQMIERCAEDAAIYRLRQWREASAPTGQLTFSLGL